MWLAQAETVRGLGRLGATLATALLVGALLGACQPVPHPELIEVEAADAPAAIIGLSPNGAFAVVQATAASTTVPGPGSWLVDRNDGAVTQLPEMRRDRVSISNDGRRVLYVDPTGWERLWDAGTVKSPPIGAVMDRDLRYGLNVNLLALDVRRWEVATGASVQVEAGHPRPPETPNPVLGADAVLGVSTDGQVVWYQLSGPGACVTRVVFLAVGQVTDLPRCGFLQVSGNGGHTLLSSPWSQIPGAPGFPKGGPAELTLVNNLTGETVASASPAVPGAYFDTVHLSADGGTAWAVATTTAPSPICVVRPEICFWQTQAHELVNLSSTGVERFPVDPRLAAAHIQDATWSTVTADGRFFAYVSKVDGAPIHVVDRLHGTDEVLPTGLAGPAGPLHLSDDGKLVAHAHATLSQSDTAPPNEIVAVAGWFERRAAAVVGP